jgi:hypothetical protein
MIFPTYRKQFIEPGINAINFHLDTVDGLTKLSNFLIHPRCRLLVDALKGGYHRLDGENKPEKDGLYDHCIAAGALVDTDKGLVPMKDIRVGMKVLTRSGLRKVLKHWSNGLKPVRKISFSNGSELICTDNHQINSNGQWVRADALRYANCCISHEEWINGSTVRSTENTKIKNIGPLTASNQDRLTCTETCGNSTTDRSPLNIKSIIKTSIQTITQSVISNVFRFLNTENSTLTNIGRSIVRKNSLNIWRTSGLLRKFGMPLELATNGIKITSQNLWGKLNPYNLSAITAVSASQVKRDNPDSARISVGQPSDGRRELIRPKESAPYACALSGSINIPKPKLVDVSVVESCTAGISEVFDISVENDHEFFANGILVHNCMDAMRYAIFMISLRLKTNEMQRAQANLQVFIDPVTGRRIESRAL